MVTVPPLPTAFRCTLQIPEVCGTGGFGAPTGFESQVGGLVLEIHVSQA